MKPSQKQVEQMSKSVWGANITALGLSNKPIETINDVQAPKLEQETAPGN